MADATFYVQHAEPVGDLPERWGDHWKHVLSSEAGRVYEALVDERLASTEVSIGRLTRYLGMSKNRFYNAVRELEKHGFAWLDAEERPPVVSINGVPEVDPDAPPVDKKRAPQTPWRTVWEFINHWCELHERYIEEPYPRPSRGRGNRDTYIIDDMLRTYALETLKQVATWFFQHRKKDEQSTLAYFQFHLPRLVTEWKDSGGVALPKMGGDSRE